jgi:hypothetical protein
MLTDDALGATLEAHGLYERSRFVIHLSPEMHSRLEKLPIGIVQGGLEAEDLYAHSVYLHEIWHWWQHIGSTFGFFSSLICPAQTQGNLKHLRELVRLFGPVKSVKQLIELTNDVGGPHSKMAIPNVIVNNFADFRIFQALCSHPERATGIVKSPYFGCKGNAFGIAYMNIVSLLARSVDKSFSTLPDPRNWETRFQELRAAPQTGSFRWIPYRCSSHRRV